MRLPRSSNLAPVVTEALFALQSCNSFQSFDGLMLWSFRASRSGSVAAEKWEKLQRLHSTVNSHRPCWRCYPRISQWKIMKRQKLIRGDFHPSVRTVAMFRRCSIDLRIFELRPRIVSYCFCTGPWKCRSHRRDFELWLSGERAKNLTISKC